MTRNTILAALVAIAAQAIPAHCSAAEPVYDSEAGLRTCCGRVAVQRERHSPWMLNWLAVGGKRIFRTRQDRILLWHRYRQGRADAVLFSEACDGSTCSEGQFSFLILQHGRQPVFVSDSDFNSADGRVEPVDAHGRIVVELGFENGLRKWAELVAGRVAVHHDPSAAQMSLDECRWLHDYMFDNCGTARPWSATCQGMTPIGSLADMGNARSLSHRPGYDQAALGRTCEAACETHERMALADFSRQVCGRPGDVQADGVDPASPASAARP